MSMHVLLLLYEYLQYLWSNLQNITPTEYTG